MDIARAKKYFEKNGFIYVISTKDNALIWRRKFTDFAVALEALNREEYDFRQRELCSKTVALSY